MPYRRPPVGRQARFQKTFLQEVQPGIEPGLRPYQRRGPPLIAAVPAETPADHEWPRMELNHRFQHVELASCRLTTGPWKWPKSESNRQNHQLLELAAFPVCVLGHEVAGPGVAPGR